MSGSRALKWLPALAKGHGPALSVAGLVPYSNLRGCKQSSAALLWRI